MENEILLTLQENTTSKFILQCFGKPKNNNMNNMNNVYDFPILFPISIQNSINFFLILTIFFLHLFINCSNLNIKKFVNDSLIILQQFCMPLPLNLSSFSESLTYIKQNDSKLNIELFRTELILILACYPIFFQFILDFKKKLE